MEHRNGNQQQLIIMSLIANLQRITVFVRRDNMSRKEAAQVPYGEHAMDEAPILRHDSTHVRDN